MEVFWLALRLLLVFTLSVLANVCQQILDHVLGLKECFCKVVLVPDELNWIVLEGSHVLLSHVENWDDGVKHDILHEWLQFLHGVFLLGAV